MGRICDVSSATVGRGERVKTVFPIFDFKKCPDLEIRVRSHARSLKVVPFDRLRMNSYECSIETLSLRPFLRYSTSIIPCDLNNWVIYGSVNVIGKVTMRYSAYDFLLTFYSNYGFISCLF